MKSYYVGIDISKKTLDWHVHEQSAHGQVSNTLTGMNKMLKTITKSGIDPKECWFCMEHTGNYGLLLCSYLQSEELAYSIVPALEIKQSIGMTRGKNDAVDAKRIAGYAYTHRESLERSKLPGELIVQVKQLLTHRQLLVRTSTKEKNSLKEVEPLAQIIDVSTIVHSKKAHLKHLKEQIRLIEKTLVQTLKQDEQLNKNLELVRSVKGIGLTIAAYLLVTTLNFTEFDNARQYNCYAGIAPFEHSSGTSLNRPTRVSKLGNKTIKALLYNGAYSAVRNDPELGHYYQRKKAENKHTQSVINAVACKLVARAFASCKKRYTLCNYISSKNHIKICLCLRIH